MMSGARSSSLLADVRDAGLLVGWSRMVKIGESPSCRPSVPSSADTEAPLFDSPSASSSSPLFLLLSLLSWLLLLSVWVQYLRMSTVLRVLPFFFDTLGGEENFSGVRIVVLDLVCRGGLLLLFLLTDLAAVWAERWRSGGALRLLGSVGSWRVDRVVDMSNWLCVDVVVLGVRVLRGVGVMSMRKLNRALSSFLVCEVVVDLILL